ncbi:NAD(P)H-dependent oxidoreductase [Brevibacterium sp. 50QC2O2]|uniref:NADPH-dependent FMN reductase n=1 Tax=Brevibacterium TaxID=1696 RepID=UPI00211B95E1|nr:MULTISPECIES: NAD(P)H-dependent oxidoreductase [unclassified Brevibacterium]MCQ9386702.1 NAD(P)H-dependent oxidoreductase [Brevibacterium sp. 68QC2CO]MCQ9389344.1 NAD(P)H-dependent oxidoreductase [Brevibacterium sp. 50QC2O2]
MLNVAIIAGTSRPGALNGQVVDWVAARTNENEDLNATVVDFSTFDLPLLDEAIPGGAHQYQNEHTKAWGAELDKYDAYIVVTPEYNHSFSGSLKNALDFVSTEFNNKVVAFVSYGADKGVRATEALRLVFANYRTAAIRGAGAFSIFTDVKDGKFAPEEVSSQTMGPLLEDLQAWGGAFKAMRQA